MPGPKVGFSPPIGESVGYMGLVSPKSLDNLPTGIDREKQVVLPPGSATPESPSNPDLDEGKNSAGEGGRDIPRFEENTPDSGSGLPERPRTLGVPGVEWGNPTKYDYNQVTRRVMDRAAMEFEAYQAQPLGKRQRKQRGINKHRSKMRYKANRHKEQVRARLYRRKNSKNSAFKRRQRHRSKYPNLHSRRASQADPLIVAAFYLEGHDWNPPDSVRPTQQQRKQKGEEKQQSKKEYRGDKSKHKKDMDKRHDFLQPKSKYQDYRKEYMDEYRQRGEKPFRRRSQVLVSPQIEFVLGSAMTGGNVRSVSPMTGMVTFVLDNGQIHSLPVLAFLHSVVFLSDGDIDAMFELVDVEVGEEAYTDLSEQDVRECARLFSVDLDTNNFANQCQALVGRSDLSSMSSSELDLVNEKLVMGVLEGGGRQRPEPGDEHPVGMADMYDWHLYYGEVPDPRVASDTFYMDQEGPSNQETNYPGEDVSYAPTSPKHYKRELGDKELPKGETGPDKHLEDVPAGSQRVVPNGEGQLWSGDPTQLMAAGSRTAATVGEIGRRTISTIHDRARTVGLRLFRADPVRGVWLFQAKGSTQEYRVRVKGIRKGNTKFVSRAQIKVSCNCNFFRWQGPEHWAKTNGYLYGRPVGSASKPVIKDPQQDHWACKHVLAVLNLVRHYRFGSEGSVFSGEYEVIPEYAATAERVADRYLARLAR